MPLQPDQPPGNRPTMIQRTWSAIRSPFKWTEEHVVEPFAKSLDQADIFKIFEKLSPVLEAIGVVAIPLVIWFATESAQEAKEKSEKAARAQEAVKTYLNQLSSVFLDGDVEKNKRLRIVTRASTLALLQDPSLEGTHKGQVIIYLIELKLIQVEEMKAGDSPEEAKTREPIISLEGSKLNDANLRETDLTGANLSRADLSRADLTGAHLSRADLTNADLTGVSLSEADLRGADLRGAYFRGTDLSYANLAGTNADRVDDFFDIFAHPSLTGAKLCGTTLPPNIKLDPNRDCKALGVSPTRLFYNMP